MEPASKLRPELRLTLCRKLRRPFLADREAPASQKCPHARPAPEHTTPVGRSHVPANRFSGSHDASSPSFYLTENRYMIVFR